MIEEFAPEPMKEGPYNTAHITMELAPETVAMLDALALLRQETIDEMLFTYASQGLRTFAGSAQDRRARALEEDAQTETNTEEE